MLTDRMCLYSCVSVLVYTDGATYQVLFKMDESGNGKLVELQDLGKANKSLVVSPFLLFCIPFHSIPLSTFHPRASPRSHSGKCASSLAVTISPLYQESGWARPPSS